MRRRWHPDSADERARVGVCREGKKLRKDARLKDVYRVGPTIGAGGTCWCSSRRPCRLPVRAGQHPRTLAPAGFSKVKIVTDRETKEQWACKIMKLPPADAETKRERAERQDTLREIDAVLDLEHPNVVGMKEYFVEHNKVYLIMELLRGEAAHARARRWCAACAVASSVRAC